MEGYDVNYDKLFNWLEENEGKPVEITVHAYEFVYNATFDQGFTIDEYALVDNETGNSIQLFPVGGIATKDYESITFDPEEMQVYPGADCEAHTQHFGIAFKLL